MAWSSSAQEITELTCEFEMQYTGIFFEYSCMLQEININDATEKIIIKGDHLPGKSNMDVKILIIIYSNTLTISRQMLEVFPNIISYIATSAGIQEITPFIFNATSDMKQVQLTYNNLGDIRSNAFYGIKDVEVIRLNSNNITSIDENVFEGLLKLEVLYLNFNLIKTLGPNTFNSLNKLVMLHFAFNRISTFHGRWAENKPYLKVLNLQGNNATVVDPSLIDNLTNLQILSMSDNICVNRIFFIKQEQLSLNYVRQELKQCFENFLQEKPKNVTRIILEIEGHLTLFNENGTVILRI